MIRRPRVCIVFVPGVPFAKQEVSALSYVTEHHLTLDSLTADFAAALALVRVELVTVVLAAFDAASVLELEGQVIEAGGRMEILRRRRPLMSTARTVQIRQASARGATPDVIATVFGMPLEHVLSALGAAVPSQRDRRPTRAAR